MVKAIWKEKVIAEADKKDCKVVEGNVYFPPSAVKKEFLKGSGTHSTCPWKGEASYYHIEVDGEVNEDAAWYYPSPKEAAHEIAGYVAFWRGVEIQE